MNELLSLPTLMNFQLITELPSWWIIFCLLIGVGYAFLFYRGDQAFDGVKKWLRFLLFFFRALVVFILTLLLLSPLIKSFIREKEKPLLIIAQDNSQSILLNKDSALYTSRDGYQKSLNEMAEDLKDKFDVKLISWGDRIKEGIDFSYSDKQTDFSELEKQLAIRYGNRNIGALVIAGDGLYNRGSSPLYENALKVPIYTIALGDTTVQKDLFIARVNYNKVVYVGNSFPIEITVNARQCSGEKSTLTIRRDSSLLFSREIAISGNRFSQLVPVMLDAGKSGMVHYKINLSKVEGEMTTLNNEQDIYIQIVDSKQKILIIGNAPHPDLGAIKKGIESSENYTVKTVLPSQNVNVKEYNLVILHNLPSVANPIKDILNQITVSKTPVWFIVGTQTSLPLFNNTASGLQIVSGESRGNKVVALFNSGFSRFTISDEFKKNISAFPPLTAPFGQYKETTDNAVLLFQQIGSISTQTPLQLFNDDGEFRKGILCGEGIWQWRLDDFASNSNFNVFNEWLLKSVQNLSVKENKTHFRLINKNNFAENEPVTFDADVYNDNYELINTPDVTIVLKNSDNKSFTYNFSKTDKSYTLNAGYLPAGQYTYKAEVKVNEKINQVSGQLSVSALQVEQTETVADHRLLFTMANKSGGKMFYPADLKSLSNELLLRDDIKTISYSHYKLRNLVDWKLIFYILLALLTLEWFLRKRTGSY